MICSDSKYLIFTDREIIEKMLMTEKEPKKESARIAPAMGNRLLEPETMLLICVACILLRLNTVIK